MRNKDLTEVTRETDGGMRPELALILAACSALQFINPVFGVTAVVVLAAIAALVVVRNSAFGRRFRLRLLGVRGLPSRLCRRWRGRSREVWGIVGNIQNCGSDRNHGLPVRHLNHWSWFCSFGGFEIQWQCIPSTGAADSALETALNRALNSAAQAKRKPSPEEYEEQLLQF
jgi:hypothetical protein